jgi:hypothetical protein
MIVSFSANVLALEITPGEWELTVKQNVSGMPVGVPTQKHRECFSDDDPIPTSFLKARQCDVIEQRVRHRTVYFKVNCFTEHGSIINEGKIKFSSLKVSGDSKTDLGEVAGRTSVLRYKFTGRRIGECSLK